MERRINTHTATHICTYISIQSLYIRIRTFMHKMCALEQLFEVRSKLHWMLLLSSSVSLPCSRRCRRCFCCWCYFAFLSFRFIHIVCCFFSTLFIRSILRFSRSLDMLCTLWIFFVCIRKTACSTWLNLYICIYRNRLYMHTNTQCVFFVVHLFPVSMCEYNISKYTKEEKKKHTSIRCETILWVCVSIRWYAFITRSEMENVCACMVVHIHTECEQRKKERKKNERKKTQQHYMLVGIDTQTLVWMLHSKYTTINLFTHSTTHTCTRFWLSVATSNTFGPV